MSAGNDGMDILVPLFANSGLAGAVLASLLFIIYILLRDRRIEHGQWTEIQKETNRALLELSGLIREYKGMSKN